MKHFFSTPFLYLLLPIAAMAQVQHVNVDKDNVNAAGLYHVNGRNTLCRSKIYKAGVEHSLF